MSTQARVAVAPVQTTAPTSLEAVVVAKALAQTEALARARRVQQDTGDRFAVVLERLGLVSEAALAQAVAEAAALPLATADAYPLVLDEALGELAPRFLRDVGAVVLELDPRSATVAFADPFEAYARHALSLALDRTIVPVVGLGSDIDAALERLYGARVEPDLANDENLDELDLERIRDLASDAPAIRAVGKLVSSAVDQRASDIHLEPTDTGLSVRFRVDGALREQDSLPSQLRASVVSRIKVMANLNIAERRLPQDGRMRMAVRGREIDFRVATAPSIHGESVVLRLLDQTRVALDYAVLGFSPELRDRFELVLSRPNGILLVTGPTGSGKTTTLYAALAALNARDRKILTVEDPVEYRMSGIVQTQVAPGIGFDFAAALRSFLRQDPDVIMVGEVRDLETAQVAVQAALTGHLILSTLHTNSAASAVTRLDMGVEPFLITSTLNAVLGQRLVRRLCVNCRTPEPASGPRAEVLRKVALARAWTATGCPACGGTGFRGRVAVLELLVMDDAVLRLVMQRAEARDIEAAAVAAGMRTLAQDGLAKVADGTTTLEEVLGAVGET